MEIFLLILNWIAFAFVICLFFYGSHIDEDKYNYYDEKGNEQDENF